MTTIGVTLGPEQIENLQQFCLSVIQGYGGGVGPAGPQGPKGDAGDTGPAGEDHDLENSQT